MREPREPGYYWVRVCYPLTDGFGVVDEQWGEPEVARLEGADDWYVAGFASALSDQHLVRVLSDRLEEPHV